MSRKRKNSKVTIVFYGFCGNRNSTFISKDEALDAAQRYSLQAGYPCEVFFCDKHLSKDGNPVPRYHIRWVGESLHVHGVDKVLDQSRSPREDTYPL